MRAILPKCAWLNEWPFYLDLFYSRIRYIHENSILCLQSSEVSGAQPLLRTGHSRYRRDIHSRGPQDQVEWSEGCKSSAM